CAAISFFFQAEDGIRDFHVTGVQTCALPISLVKRRVMSRRLISALMARPLDPRAAARSHAPAALLSLLVRPVRRSTRGGAHQHRSEERRVGEEGRPAWSPCRERVRPYAVRGR